MTTKKITVAGMCLTLCMLLPFLTGQIPQIGNALSPMHIPVLLCGFVCGGGYGAFIGFIAPLLRSVLLNSPPLFPIATAMAFELAAYGLVSGILYRILSKKTINIYSSLIGAMLIGRLVWGVTRFIMAVLFDVEFTLNMFLSGAFIIAIPAIICHIILIPILVIVLKNAGFMSGEKKTRVHIEQN